MADSTLPSHRCPTCESTLENARNLAVFIDGTSNKPGPKETNVMKLHNLMSDIEGPTLKQRKYYLEGIGVHDVDKLSKLGRARMKIYSGLEMAFAWNVEKNVMTAYSWLARSYRKGDQIYLFGFSRGAYQVRALAGMIHEVGLVKEPRRRRIEQAYHRYLSIDPNNPQTREAATQFKRDFCLDGVRIHFVGVWDTVSSLGLVKQDVHITASASVTNACHFRHALALDERRVKFMPEYFSEVNPHDAKIKSQRRAVSDVKEVWFAGYHSDVGGMSRPNNGGFPALVVDEHSPIHAGNVPLRWMQREANAKGLVFKSEMFSWWPEDVDLGRKDTMSFFWRIPEVVRVRHQVSFGGTGKHERRKHGFRPRPVIPDQQIHFSVLPGDVYTPQATLAHGVDIPTVPQMASNAPWPTEPWTTGLEDRRTTTTTLLESLLSDQQTTLRSLGEVLLLLVSRLDNGQTPNIPHPGPQWSELSIREQSGLDRFALAVIYDVTFFVEGDANPVANFSASKELVRDARESLDIILPFPDHVDFTRALYILRFSARHPTLRERFIAHDSVVNALILALDWAKSRDEYPFLLIMDSLRHLIDGSDQRNYVINQLTAELDETKAGKIRLSLALEAKAPSYLTSSLKLIASLAQHQPGHCKGLIPRIVELARKRRGSVGSVAVEALVALKVPLARDVRFSNILGYLGNTLPQLGAEVRGTSSSDVTVALPPVFQLDGSGGIDSKDVVMNELIRTIESRDVHQRTAATLTLLKLCRYSIVRDFCLQKEILDVFMKQMERKETPLLAAYALKTCLGLEMWSSSDLSRAAQPILTMLNNCWFDDAVGRVEGSEIFRELITSGDLRKQVINAGAITTLEKKLENGNHHETRMSLVCLDVLWSEIPAELGRTVAHSLTLLTNKDMRTQKKGVKTLSSLARTVAGEQAIKPHVVEIVKMLLPPSDGSPVPRSRLFGPTAALYDLCRNETLREEILKSNEFAAFKRQRHDGNLYPQTR